MSYPDYVQRMLNDAKMMLKNDRFSQPDVAAICYDILTLFPDHVEASAFILELFSDPQLIRDNRKAIGRHVDEWDDRQWQERRRLALSFSFMSRWEGNYRPFMPPAGDMQEMLEEGRDQLLQDYLLGQSKGSEVAWPILQEAIRRTNQPVATMMWIGALYAEQGYFAEAVEVLEDLLHQFPKTEQARRLWAEVRWWRDHQHEIPWIPPETEGNGRRFHRIMTRNNADYAADPAAYMEPLEYQPPDSSKLPIDFKLPPKLSTELINKIKAAFDSPLTVPTKDSPVNWGYLELLEMDAIDSSQFPEWAQYMLLEIDDIEQERHLKEWLVAYLANPSLREEEE